MAKVEVNDDIRKDYEDDYNEAIDYWHVTYEEMYTDIKMYLGDQWNESEKGYLKEEGRNAYVYNYCQRNIHLNSGYQRKNRLGFGIDPQQAGDEQFSDYAQDALIWQANKCDFYHKFSDGFEDASITGFSLMSFGIDYSRDLINGRIYCDVEPFQSVVLDPLFTKIDLSDCRYMIKRQYISKEKAKALLPSAKKKIEDVKTGRIDNKFDYMSFSRNRMDERDIVAYDEYYKRTEQKVYVVTHAVTGETQTFRGSRKELNELIGADPFIEVAENFEPTVEYHVFVQGELMYSGVDPLGIGDFPCVPILWVYKPQFDDYAYKMQGMIRSIRDPQSEYNRKRSKIADILDSQVSVGWVVEKGAVVNQDDLFKTGQGQVIETEIGKLGAIREKQSVDMPAGLVNLVAQLTTDLIQIPGLNEEALGVAEGGNTEVSGTLAKQRAANSITVFQTVYDKLAQSQKECASKILKIMLTNYTPEMWQKITGKPMPEGLTTDKVFDFDIVVKETLLTDSQKNLAYFQALEAMKAGINVPQQYLIEQMPMADKTHLLEMYQQEAQQAQEVQQKQEQLQMMELEAKIGLVNAQAIADKGLGLERVSRIEENQMLAVERRATAIKDLESAALDKIKAVKEIQGIDLAHIQAALEIIEKLKMEEREQAQDLANTPQNQAVSQENVQEPTTQNTGI